jgi:Flp pilus assembly protein TadD
MAQLTLQQAFDKAQRHQQDGRPHQAEDLYRQIIKLQPRHAAAMHYLGLALHQQGQTDAAIDLIRKAIAQSPNVPEAHNSLGVTLQSKRQFAEAIDAFGRALTLKPAYASAHYNLANALNEAGRPEEAIAAYRRAIALNPKFLKAHHNLGDTLLNQGQASAAISAYREAIAIKPDSDEAHNKLAHALRKIGQTEEAVAAWRKAIALMPGPSAARSDRKIIIPPYHGEFGSLLIRHVRFVHELDAREKLVCCRRGQEMFYPTATGFVYEWEDPGADVSIPGDGPKGKAPQREGYTPVDPVYRIHEPWKKFKLSAPHRLPAVDVALGVRQRTQKFEAEGREPSRNWTHWDWLATQLRKAKLSVGLVGHPSSSQNVQSDAVAWDHPDGFNAGSVDLLTHCRVYLGTDTGTTHLAAFCDAPTIGFRIDTSGVDWMVYAQAMNQNVFKRLPHSAWEDRQAVLDAVFDFLRLRPRLH